MKSPSSAREAQLLETAASFCQALLENPPPPPLALISRFFVPSFPSARGSKAELSISRPNLKLSPPRITEHGPEWARSRLPFLAKTFTGEDECIEYFTLLSKTLKMHMGKDTFPSVESGGFVVDAEAQVEGEDEDMLGIVSVVGKARFESVKTGKDWEEQFIYRFSGFDQEGKIGHWEIWADPLSAWVACE